jgi:hypothetical protein
MYEDSLISILADEDGKQRKKLIEKFGFSEKDIPSWQFIKIPIAKEFRPDMKPEEIQSVWEDRFPPSVIKSTYAQYAMAGVENLFYQEYMLKLADAGTSIFKVDNIRRVSRRDISKMLDFMTIYISIDLSATTSSTSDYASVVVIGVHNETGHWFLIDGVFGNLDTDEVMNYIFIFHRLYKSYSVVFESVVFSTLFKYILEKEMVRRRVILNIETFHRSHTSKLSVFKQFAIIVNRSSFWISDSGSNEDDYLALTKELFEEMKLITNNGILASRDDVLDSIAQLTLIEIVLPDINVDEHSEDDIIEWKNPYEF